MPCGPANARSVASGGARASSDPFSFAEGGALMQGFTTWAAMWAAPWKAAFIVAEEALRDGRPNRDTDA